MHSIFQKFEKLLVLRTVVCTFPALVLGSEQRWLDEVMLLACRRPIRQDDRFIS